MNTYDFKGLSYNKYIFQHGSTKTKDILTLIDKVYPSKSELISSIASYNFSNAVKTQLIDAASTKNCLTLRDCAKFAYSSKTKQKAQSVGIQQNSSYYTHFEDLETERILYELFGDVDTEYNLRQQQLLLCSATSDFPQVGYLWAHEDACAFCKDCHNKQTQITLEDFNFFKDILLHPHCDCDFDLELPVINQFLPAKHDVSTINLKEVLKSTWESLKESLFGTPEKIAHTVLDILGFIPVVGAVFDAANAIFYLVEGDYLNAALSGIGALPLIGYFGTGSKFVKTGAKAIDAALDAGKVVDKVSDAIKAIDSVADASKALDKAGDIAKYLDKIKDTSKIINNIEDYTKMATKIDNIKKYIDISGDTAKISADILNDLKKIGRNSTPIIDKFADTQKAISAADIYKQISNATDAGTTIKRKFTSNNFTDQINEVFESSNHIQKIIDNAPKQTPKIGISDVLDSPNLNKSLQSGASSDILNSRRTWKQSEIDIGEKYPDFESQVSFKDGKIVKRNTKGSVRPDLYRDGVSIEIKNYDLSTPQRRSSMVNKLKEQYYQRLNNLPEGTKQIAILDISGQNIEKKILEDILEHLKYYNEVRLER